MNGPVERPYTASERRAIIMEARRVAKELLTKLELLARMDGVNDEAVEVVNQLKERIDGGGNGGDASG